MIKDKRGFLFAIPFAVIFTLILGVILLALAIWFSFRVGDILDPLSPIFTFIKEKWWIVALMIGALVWHAEIAAIIRFILGKIGIRV